VIVNDNISWGGPLSLAMSQMTHHEITAV
jgi:hypothetical protein